MSAAGTSGNANFNPLLDIRPYPAELNFEYGEGVFGPEPEIRRLGDIRASLRETSCDGPDPVYAIAMDVGRAEHKTELQQRMLLFGVVLYAEGQLGEEPVRSQGHIHRVAPHCGWSTPELIEVWQGKAVVYLQRNVTDHPGICVAVSVDPGECVVVPPGWGHFVANADPKSRLLFGAFCDRQYGFEYSAVRRRGGLAWFPLVKENGSLRWERNNKYPVTAITLKRAREYPELGLLPATPIYKQFAERPDSLQWVSEPGRMESIWEQFVP